MLFKTHQPIAVYSYECGPDRHLKCNLKRLYLLKKNIKQISFFLNNLLKGHNGSHGRGQEEIIDICT